MILNKKIGALLLITVLSGCSKEPSVSGEIEQEDTSMELMEKASNESPIIVKFNQITSVLEHEPLNFMELKNEKGYAPFYPEYSFLEKLDADMFPQAPLQKCYGCYRKIDTLNAFKQKLNLADSEILVIGMNDELGKAQHEISFSDDYQLRAANDLAINYIRYKKSDNNFVNTNQEFDYDLKYLEQVFNIVTTKLTFNVSYQGAYGVPVDPNDLPDNYITYDPPKKIISFQNMEATNADHKFRLDFKAKADKETADKIIHVNTPLHLGYILSFSDNKLALEKILVFSDAKDQNTHSTSYNFDLISVFDPLDLTFQRYKYNVGEYMPLEKVNVKVGMPIDFKFGLQSYTPIEKIYKPMD